LSGNKFGSRISRSAILEFAMAESRRRHCIHCGQTFISSDTETCSLCRKSGGLIDADAAAIAKKRAESVPIAAGAALASPQVDLPQSPNEGIAAGSPQAVTPSSAIQAAERQANDSQATEVSSSAPATAPASFCGKAAVSLVLGLLMLVPVPLLLLCSIPAIILGVWALVEIRQSNGRLRGTGLAIAGIAIGAVTPLLVFFVLVPLVERLRETAGDTVSRNNLKQIALALEVHDEVYKTLPQQAIYSPDGRPLLSWRVAILGYIEQETLRRQFKLDESWDSPHNRVLLHSMPPIYRMPGQSPQASETVYQGLVGKNTIFRASHLEKVTLRDITDGLENTIMVVEAANAVPWTKPEDLPYDPDGPLPSLGGKLSSGFNAGLANGSVIRIDPRTVSERTLRHAITINDGQSLGSDWPGRSR
jgi:hypothetical protein